MSGRGFAMEPSEGVRESLRFARRDSDGQTSMGFGAVLESRPEATADFIELFDDGDVHEPQSLGVEIVELTGRKLLQDGDVLVLDVDVEDGGWEIPGPPVELLVRLDDGSVITVELVGDRSTRAGRVTAGTTVRIAIKWPPELPACAFVLVIPTPPDEAEVEIRIDRG